MRDCTTYVMVSALQYKDIFCVDIKFKSELGSYDINAYFMTKSIC